MGVRTGMKQHGNRIWTSLLAAILAGSVLAGCHGKPAETEGNVASAPQVEASAAPVREEVVELPPAMPAVGVGRIMPEVVAHDGVNMPETYNWDGNDRFNPNERVAMMNDLKPDYIVSIHTNTAGNPNACGVQVYYDHVSSFKDNDWNEPAAITIAETIDELVETTAETDLRNPINADNASLAVIRDTHPAACLIELGFCTNEKDAANLTDPAWQASVANAIAEGIERFFDSMEN